LNLHIRAKEKERLLNEQERMHKRNEQIVRQVEILNREMTRLLKLAMGAEEVEERTSKPHSKSSEKQGKGRLVVRF
jgi:hypothetical protein